MINRLNCTWLQGHCRTQLVDVITLTHSERFCGGHNLQGCSSVITRTSQTVEATAQTEEGNGGISTFPLRLVSSPSFFFCHLQPVMAPSPSAKGAERRRRRRAFLHQQLSRGDTWPYCDPTSNGKHREEGLPQDRHFHRLSEQRWEIPEKIWRSEIKINFVISSMSVYGNTVFAAAGRTICASV